MSLAELCAFDDEGDGDDEKGGEDIPSNEYVSEDVYEAMRSVCLHHHLHPVNIACLH